MPTPILIIGFGSGLRGDDALGPLAAERLDAQIDDPRVRILSAASLTPELAADAADAQLVIFIDCAATGPVGEVICTPIDRADDASAAMVHFLDPPALLHWAARLFGATPRGYTLSIPGATFDIAEDLSPPVKAALPELLATARRLIDAHLPSPAQTAAKFALPA